MATFAAGTIPFCAIESIRIVRDNKCSPRTILHCLEADHIINGTLYNMRTGEVNCHLKVNGEVIAKPRYTVWGYAWNNPRDFTFTVLPNANYANYIACTLLVKDGRELVRLTYDKGQGGVRQRTAMGIKNGSLALYLNQKGITPAHLARDLALAGWENAIMLDGGGSTQGVINGITVPSTRRVNHYIVVSEKR